MSEVTCVDRQPAAVVGPAIRTKIASGETVLLQVTGRSMTPLFHDRRDAVLLVGVTVWPPKPGDILFAQRADESYVLHRVIRIVGDGCIFNGDGQLWIEGPIPRNQVIAQVQAFRRKGKFYPVTHPLYRAYVRIWMGLRPIRRRLFALGRFAKRLCGKK
ncbi:MAG: S24/S26 family peptidase [Clostridia bacterium]